MAKGTSQNGHVRLEEAIALLINNQAAFVGQIAENERLRREYEREANERTNRLETQMKDVVRILTDHTRQLERLADAVREQIGFKAK